MVAGAGYRKALEYLIKDFLIKHKFKNDKQKEEDIKDQQLGTCLNNYIDDARVQAIAKRAAWLGNDETHYSRKWENHDIEDLKNLIQLTVNWIDSIIVSDKYIQDMPPKAKPEKS